MPYQILYVGSLTTKVTKLGGRAFGNWWGLSIKFLCGSFESPASRVTSGETEFYKVGLHLGKWVTWGCIPEGYVSQPNPYHTLSPHYSEQVLP